MQDSKRVTIIERTHAGFMGFLTVEDESGERRTLADLASVFACDHIGDRGTITLVSYSDGPAWVYEPLNCQGD